MSVEHMLKHNLQYDFVSCIYELELEIVRVVLISYAKSCTQRQKGTVGRGQIF